MEFRYLGFEHANLLWIFVMDTDTLTYRQPYGL